MYKKHMETWGQRDTAGVREKKSKRKAVNLSALSLRDELLAEKKTKQNCVPAATDSTS